MQDQSSQQGPGSVVECNQWHGRFTPISRTRPIRFIIFRLVRYDQLTDSAISFLTLADFRKGSAIRVQVGRPVVYGSWPKRVEKRDRLRGSRMSTLRTNLAALILLFAIPLERAEDVAFERPDSLQPAIAFC